MLLTSVSAKKNRMKVYSNTFKFFIKCNEGCAAILNASWVVYLALS